MRRRTFFLGAAVLATVGLGLVSATEGMTTTAQEAGAGLYPTPIPNPPVHGPPPARNLATSTPDRQDQRSAIVDVGGGALEQWWLDTDPAQAETQASAELAKHPGARLIQRLPSPREVEKAVRMP